MEFKFSQDVKSFIQKLGLYVIEKQSSLKDIQFKSDKDLVTEADLECERRIVEFLRKLTPDYNIVGEENTRDDNNSEFTWYIDPIDGTVNYSRGLPYWGISISLMKDGEPYFAVVNLPKLDVILEAYKGHGCYANGNKQSVSSKNNFSEMIVSNGDFNVGDIEVINAENIHNITVQAKHFQRVKFMGTAAVESTHVAMGMLDAYCMTMSFPWDTIAGTLFVTESGGKVTRIDGSPMQFVDGEKVLFSNGHRHKDIIELLKS